MSRYYVIYEEYQDYNQFEGTWNTEFKGFDKLFEALDFMENSAAARDCRAYERTLIGPLELIRPETDEHEEQQKEGQG